MSSLPSISVITISYNAQKVIERTINSILQLNYPRIELIFVDGLSTDNTVEVIQSYHNALLEKGIQYRLVSEKDTGIYNAMNKGLNLASGDSVIFMNSGDYFHPHFNLNDLVQQIDVKTNIVVGYSIQVFEDLFFLRTKPEREGHLLNYPAHQAVFVPKFVYQQVLFDENLKIAADYFWIKRAMTLANAKIYQNVISVFELGGKSSSSLFSDIYLLHKETNEGNIWVKTVLKYLSFLILGKQNTFKLLYRNKYLLISGENAFNKQII